MTRQLQTFDDIDSLPTEYQRRTYTDKFCVVLGIGFSLIMIFLAIALFKYNNFVKVNFPTDSDGRLCGIDSPQYPFVYFVNPPNMDKRVCVRSCPQNGDENMQCLPTATSGCRFQKTKGFEVIFYNNEPSKTRNGNFCFPTDQELKESLLQNSNLTDRNSFFNSLDTIVICFFLAFLVSLLFMILVQCLPSVMNYATIGFGIVAILVSAICVFLYPTTETTAKIIIGICLIVVLIIILLTICKNMDSWKMHSIFLNYATKMTCDRCSTFFYIPIFLLILVGFVVILVLEFTAYWTSGEVKFQGNDKSLYYSIHGSSPIILTIFLIIQGIWGLSFIKESFNFCVSGQAVNWYFEREDLGFCYSFKLLLCKHFGSVIGGAFMTGFLSLEDFIFDFLKPDVNANPDGCYTSCYGCCCILCIKIFDMVRSDAMAYINLTGNPYCNSSRYCEYLCDRSIIMDYSQSTSRAYRICAHFLVTGLMTILALYIKGNISIYALLVIMIQTIFISTLFISVHADATEAIQIIFLADEEFLRQRKEDEQTYDRGNIEENLLGFRRRNDLAEEVKKEREFQKKKREEEEDD